MFHKIWYPEENDLIKFKILSMVSIPVCMLLPLIFNILLPSFAWYLVSLLWLVIVIAIRIISAVRYQAQATLDIKPKSNKLFGKLSDKDRKHFIVNAFFKIPIVFTIAITGSLLLINIIKPLNIIFIAVFVLLVLPVYLYGIWNLYNKMVQGKDLSNYME